VVSVDNPDAPEETLIAALNRGVLDRLRAAGPTPRAALEAIVEDLAGSRMSLPSGQFMELAGAVATAHGVSPDEATRFRIGAWNAEAHRRQARRASDKRARECRREEVRRLRAWERSLVGFNEIPALLTCTPKEARSWIAVNLIPVARRVASRAGERWEFDPIELERLRPSIPDWRKRDRIGSFGRSARRGRTDLPLPALNLGDGANAAVARVAALDRYAAHFATARALDRRITLITGPTNSGKSHTALDRLASAQNGIALAPLRLLAHEFREALEARGVAASLTTGEERILVPGSRHLAATVEMCQFHDPVEVALIDEAQMLHDRDRGAAWTAAIMGVPARNVLVLGAPDGVPMVRRIAALCGDPVEEISLRRKAPLLAASKPIAPGELAPGDAVVAFSRHDVLALRAELIGRGKQVAVVYGALSPEVRRAEAARFNRGEAEILVCTDAIGMGLNLNIRRIIFSAVRKFDGEASRELTAQEVKQIGGRAGRYGMHDEGLVGVLSGAGSPDFVRRMLDAPAQPPADLRPQVQPDVDIVAAVAAEIGSDSLFGVLARIKRAVLRQDDPNYRLADLTQPLAIASVVDGVAGLNLTTRWTYAMCPIDERDHGIARLARWADEHAAGHVVAPPVAGRLPSPHRAEQRELERAEKIYKRLVAWRWMSQRFPDTYRDGDTAENERLRLDTWIEGVLRQQRRGRVALAV
jgi:ATP-dependent RNA helicase SUPV3L1/SUV3